MQYSFTLARSTPISGTSGAQPALTLSLSVLAIIISLILGAGVAVMRRARLRALRIAGAAYVEVMRNTPLLVILYIVYFAGPVLRHPPQLLQRRPDRPVAPRCRLHDRDHARRADRGATRPIEAADARLDALQTFRHVVFPQVFRTIYAPLGNQFIAIILASSLTSAIAVNEVASWMETAGSASFRFFETFLVAAIVYLVLCQAVNLARLGIGRMLFRAGGSSAMNAPCCLLPLLFKAAGPRSGCPGSRC